MTPLIVNDLKYRCPDCWADVSTRLFQRIITEWEPDKSLSENKVKLFSILSGADFDTILDQDDPMTEALIYWCVNFVYVEDLKRIKMPEDIFIGDRTVLIPKDVGDLTTGQNMHVRGAMESVPNSNAVMSRVVAIYMQRHYNAEMKGDELILPRYRSEQVDKIEAMILDLPITQIYPIGFFFCKKLSNYGTWWQRLWYQIRLLKTRPARLSPN